MAKPILAIDPGNEQSAFVLWDGKRIINADTLKNQSLLDAIYGYGGIFNRDFTLVIEMVASYGMPVGESVFETVFWIGRFCEAYELDWYRLYRKDVKMHLCHTMRAKDSNIRQALVDRFGDKPTKKRPNPVYGGAKLKKDEWQAFALAVTFYDTRRETI